MAFNKAGVYDHELLLERKKARDTPEPTKEPAAAPVEEATKDLPERKDRSMFQGAQMTWERARFFLNANCLS